MKIELDRQKIKKVPTKTLVKNIDYYQAVAKALLIYAKNNDDFAYYLSEAINDLNIKDSVQIDEISADPRLLIPLDYYSAVEKTNWLLGNIDTNDKSGQEIATMLQTGVRSIDIKDPQSIVIGVIGMAIAGPTLGILSTKKKKHMSLLINTDCPQVPAIKLAETAVKLSHELFKQELKQVNNKMNKIDPDFADWFFGEKGMIFYQANDKQIRNIKNDLKALSIKHTTFGYKDKIRMLAVSPAINETYQEMIWNLERMD